MGENVYSSAKQYIGLCTELNRAGILQSGRVIYLFFCAPTGHGLSFSCPVPRSGFVRGKKNANPITNPIINPISNPITAINRTNIHVEVEFLILYYCTLSIDITCPKRILFCTGPGVHFDFLRPTTTGVSSPEKADFDIFSTKHANKKMPKSAFSTRRDGLSNNYTSFKTDTFP